MLESLIKPFEQALKNLGIENPKVNFEYPENPQHGDFSTNSALVYAKNLGMTPRECATRLIEEVTKNLPQYVKSLASAGPGFINITMNPEFFTTILLDMGKHGDTLGTSHEGKGKKIMVEYTDPNPFKIFHIGHLMANSIGESISKLIETTGAQVIRVCYQGDVGMHVARTLWAVEKNKDSFPDENTPLLDRINFLGKMYVLGSEKYDVDEVAKKEIVETNKKIFEKSDLVLNEFYDKGRAWSLEYFDQIYAKLGTQFKHFFFESEVADIGVTVVNSFLEKGIFEKSDGAVIFPGEKYGEHTRVFINSQGLPTYEAKEIGLTEKKFSLYPDLAESVVVTANEQNDYFKVILAALKVMSPSYASRMRHISHGILRPVSGKMSSRKGNIVPAETFIEEFEAMVDEKIQGRELDDVEKKDIREKVAIAGIKYAILRQSIGGDIIYDPHKALSFEGDSGPYLQYTTVRARAVLLKASENHISTDITHFPQEIHILEKLLTRFPEIVARARREYAPHYIVTYLIEVASAFNSYYASHTIIDIQDNLSPYRVHLTKLCAQILEKGLWILGIQVPKKM